MSQANQVRTYDSSASVVFLKTNERFGGLSNMAPGFPLRVNGVRIRTSEALYQACRFPHLPDVQRKIIDEHSPMTAKMRSKPFRKDSRPDWDAVRVKIMRWCLRVKLAQNWREFSRLLLATGDRSIVEQSRKDDFWGAKVAEDGSLVGMNVLGRLLMELREQLKCDEAKSLRFIEPLAIPEFLLFRQPIEAICAADGGAKPLEIEPHSSQPTASPLTRDLPQPSLFDQQTIARGKMDIQKSNGPAEAHTSKNLMPYSGYRDSGLPWLGEIPQHWDVCRNGRLFAERNQTGFEDLPILEVSLRTGVRIRDMENGARKQQMTDRSKYKRAAKGDIAYNMMRMWQGAVGVAPVDGLISPAYVVACPFPEVETRYFAYLFRTDAYMREVNKFSRGIVSDRNRLYWDEFKQMPSAFPPTEEQSRIADFLDAHGRLTARLIRNKRRLIGLLNEQKQAIINRAVTRGLNPDAPMKRTGVDWMPEVPAHWDVTRLKTVCRFVYGDALADQNRRPGEVKVFGSNGPVGLHDEANTAGPCLLIGRKGSFGKINFSEDQAFAIDTVFYVDRHSTRQNLRWLYYLLQCLKLDSVSKDAAVPGLDREDAHNNRVPLCCHEEQHQLATFLDSELAKLNSVISRVQRKIGLINEFRERLIADVVTGNLDVRHIEIAVPAHEPITDEDNALEEELEDGDAEVMEGTDADD